jgi:methionyl-tRNA formyltransferase
MDALGPYRSILLLGGGELLRDICIWAVANSYEVRVVTSPRHATELHDGVTLAGFLESQGIAHIIAENISAPETISFIGNLDETFSLSLGAAWIFKQSLLETTFKNKLMNLHGRRLPQNRGGGGFSWQILTGFRFGFCVLHVVDSGVDTGDIILTEEFLYPASCRTPQDYQRFYIQRNFVFLTEFLKETRTSQRNVKPIVQPEYFSTYWPRLSTAVNSWIDWSWDAHELDRFICAFDDPYSGAQTFCSLSRQPRMARLKSVSLNPEDGSFHSYQAGLIYRKSKGWLCVAAKGAGLIVESIRDENDADLFSEIKVGDRLFTSSEMLASGRQRVSYAPGGMVAIKTPPLSL